MNWCHIVARSEVSLCFCWGLNLVQHIADQPNFYAKAEAGLLIADSTWNKLFPCPVLHAETRKQIQQSSVIQTTSLSESTGLAQSIIIHACEGLLNNVPARKGDSPAYDC